MSVDALAIYLDVSIKYDGYVIPEVMYAERKEREATVLGADTVKNHEL